MATSKMRLYRFRPLQILPNATPPKTVADELRARELYLGTLEQNNDPMDGIQDAYWEGDEVLWRNFVRHYCFCLLHASCIVSLSGNSIPFGPDDVLARGTPDDWSGVPMQHIYEEFVSAVTGNKQISELVSLLIDKQRLSKDELRLLLDTYHRQFLSPLRDTLRQNGFINFLKGLDLESPEIRFADFVVSVRRADSQMLSRLAGAAEQASLQVQLIGMYEHAQQLSVQAVAKRNLQTLLNGFPTLYLDACVKAIYDEYYIACFTERNDNESMWGHYAAGHRGICLIFEFDERDGGMQMHLQDQTTLALHQIRYSAEPPRVNVFAGLGYLPRPLLQKYWLTSEERVSPLASKYSSPDYHSEYWQAYASTVSHKFSEWEREREYRAVMSAWFYGRKAAPERLTHYHEKHLKGVIFGMRTPVDAQLQIMSALDETLSSAQKEEFEFHRARYCPLKKSLEISRLDLLKFT